MRVRACHHPQQRFPTRQVVTDMNHGLLAFSLVAFVAIATPGPTVLLALHNGSRHGVRAALAGMLGAVTSDFILVASVAAGLGALLSASEFWFSVVKWIGVAYLAFLGLRMLASRGDAGLQPDLGVGAQASHRSLYLRSLLVAITNPKGYLFCSALLPQFIVPHEPMLPQYLALALLFAGIDFLIMLAYAAAGARAIRVLHRRGMLWLDRVCGGTLLALAGTLALLRRQG
jgi:threonine/homoserine/homoserine lactone efflux protein